MFNITRSLRKSVYLFLLPAVQWSLPRPSFAPPLLTAAGWKFSCTAGPRGGAQVSVDVTLVLAPSRAPGHPTRMLACLYTYPDLVLVGPSHRDGQRPLHPRPLLGAARPPLGQIFVSPLRPAAPRIGRQNRFRSCTHKCTYQ